MEIKSLHLILIIIFAICSLAMVIFSILFILNNEISVKYYFSEVAFLDKNIETSMPICRKEYFLEIILLAKFVFLYGLFGFILSIVCIRSCIWKNKEFCRYRINRRPKGLNKLHDGSN